MLCVVATYMVAKTRLRVLERSGGVERSPGRSRRLGGRSRTFPDSSGNVELARFSRVRTILDVSRAFTDERAKKFRNRDDDREDDDTSVVVDSLVTMDEARRELDAMRDGTVGVRVGRSVGEAFLRRGDAYDCVSHEANDGWTIRKGCGRTLLNHRAEEDAKSSS